MGNHRPTPTIDHWESVHASVDLRGALAAVSFWSGIALPALYLPLLLAGLESVEGLAAFLGLFGLHVLALVGGRCHRRGSDE